MKTLKHLVAIAVVIGVCATLRAEGLKHIVWQTPGTNIVVIASADTTSNPIISNSLTGRLRTEAHIQNTNLIQSVGIKLSGTFPNVSTNSPDYIIPPKGSLTLYFGEGYSGSITARALTNGTQPIIYWDAGY